MNDEQKKKFTAIVRQLKKQKNFSMKNAEFQKDLKFYQEQQKKLADIKKQYADEEIVQKAADEENKKLQSIISNINEYMSILHPEGLLDFGAGSTGQQIVGQG